MELTALAPFGAEVRGWQPHRDLGDDELRFLREALATHVLLVFRGHPIPTHEELARFALRFGEVAAAGEMYGIELAQREVLEVSNELDERGKERGVAGSGAIPWHTDYSFQARAAKETFLEAYRLPPSGGPQTCFMNMYAAYEALPASRQARLDGMVARHTLWAASAYASPDDDPDERDARTRQANPDLRYPDDGSGVLHPVVRSHPDTGRKALYVSSFVREFEGVPEDRSAHMGFTSTIVSPRPQGRALLDALLRHAESLGQCYCHTWQVGDLVLSDQVGTVHRRGTVFARDARTMRQLSTLLPA